RHVNKRRLRMKNEDVSDVTPAAAVSVPARSVRRRVRQVTTRRRVIMAAVPTPNAKAIVDGASAAASRRRVLADVCKVFGDHLASARGRGEELGLPPRLQQTLGRLI